MKKRKLLFLACGLLISTNYSFSTAASEDQPTVAKDSVQVTAFTFDVHRKNYDLWSWVPSMGKRE
ncbi:MAG TPA: hypothetical protein VGQ39_07985 [Pyrinomonadaceae bacterium]|jgi:hypothetical protein|nr:hypothetical protein [Pyrinomonadaceae bacterium]